MKKKLLPALILAGSLTVPVAASAEGMIGTDVYALSSSLPNVFYQGKINDTSAWRASFASVSVSGVTVSMIGGDYKMYFGGEYASAPFVQAGVIVGTGSGGTATLGTVGVGYDYTLAESFVLGAYYGMIFGAGGSAGGIAITAAYNL